MQYGGRGEVDIRGVPEVTHHRSEHPLVVELNAEVERHHDHRYEDICERQRHHEVVGDDAEFTVTSYVGFM